MSAEAARTDYEERALRIAAELRLTVKIERGPDKCPGWAGEREKRPHGCARCGAIHGLNYWVTIHRMHERPGQRRVLGFDYWGSWADAHPDPYKERLLVRPKPPSVYDVLATVSSDASGPTDPDEVVAEYGEMKPSQAIAVAKWAARLQRFFTAEELEKLAEVDQ